MTLQCAKCIVSHGAPGCIATHETETGEPSCTWHLDGELCPIEQKQQRASRKKTPEETPPAASGENSEKPASEQESGVTSMKTPETDANIAPKICARPGCTIELSTRNQVGLCQRHVRWTAPGERAASSAAPTNGHAHAHAPGNGHAAAGSNGSGEKTNGHALKADREVTTPANGSNGDGKIATLPDLGDFSAERIDRLIATLPLADRAKFALAWLRGQL
jgi:hypothetical protein